jgi:hypothetical protein
MQHTHTTLKYNTYTKNEQQRKAIHVVNVSLVVFQYNIYNLEGLYLLLPELNWKDDCLPKIKLLFLDIFLSPIYLKREPDVVQCVKLTSHRCT